jgi:NAD(P)H-dependent FMN reductase
VFIPVILGTARVGRYSEKVASFVISKVKEAGIETQLLDVKDLGIMATDNTRTDVMAKEYASVIERADGLIVVSPEYNHGYPGELKLALDLAYTEYFHKPVGFCGVSMSSWGGARCVEKLRLVAVELHMVPVREALYFPNVREMFVDGMFARIETKNDYDRRFKRFIEEIEWYALALRNARENDKGKNSV